MEKFFLVEEVFVVLRMLGRGHGDVGFEVLKVVT
jgi:hypothetical protein